MRPSPRAPALRSPRELEAVASPLRVEILEQLEHAGTLSVSQLARLLDRPAPLLHYHVRLLLDAGPVHMAGSQAASRRGEALFTRESRRRLRASRRRPRVLQPEREALAALTLVLAPAGRRPAQRDS